MAAGIDEDAIGDAHGQVAGGAFHLNALFALQPGDILVLPHTKFLPARHRIRFVQQARAINKVFIFAQAHQQARKQQQNNRAQNILLKT